MTDDRALGLRERKKLETRKALSDAAVELMFERGLENVVREDIAARAGVSLRTFSNHFNGKFDALAYRVSDRFRRSAELLSTRPAGEPLWTAITEAMIEPLVADRSPFGRPTEAQLVEVRKLNATPELQAAVAQATLDDLVQAVAARTRTDPVKDLYPRLVAGVTASVVNAVLESYVSADPPASVVTMLREAFSAVAAGLPPPAH